jgi:hypothetical protein
VCPVRWETGILGDDRARDTAVQLRSVQRDADDDLLGVGRGACIDALAGSLPGTQPPGDGRIRVGPAPVSAEVVAEDGRDEDAVVFADDAGGGGGDAGGIAGGDVMGGVVE